MTALGLLRKFSKSSRLLAANTRSLSNDIVPVEKIPAHTDKWMQRKRIPSPMELINQVAPIKVQGNLAACQGDSDASLGHPIEYICLDPEEPQVCKYCGLRYVQDRDCIL